MSGDESIGAVEDRVGNACEYSRSAPCERHRLQKPYHSGPVTDNGSVGAGEPPRGEELVLREVGEERPGFRIGEWKNCELVSPVEADDDTRRPGAEASAAVVQQHRPSKLRAHYRLARYAAAGLPAGVKIPIKVIS